jgi:hypothetical protein
MFLELCGKLCFSHIRPAFFYCLLLIPFFLAGTILLSRYTALQQQEARFADAARKGKGALERKIRKERFIERYASPDPFFLDNQIESLVFLEKEISKIKAVIHHPALSNKRYLQERLMFLESNAIAFTEENIRTASRIKETEEKQRCPVEMDEGDLQTLLARIEDIPVGGAQPVSKMPQLIIRDLSMKKRETPQRLENYEVEMELLKREWITP